MKRFLTTVTFFALLLALWHFGRDFMVHPHPWWDAMSQAHAWWPADVTRWPEQADAPLRLTAELLRRDA